MNWLRRLFRREKVEYCSNISDEDLLKRGSPLDSISIPASSAGVTLKWCRANLPTKAQNHMGRCHYTGKFCDPAKRTGNLRYYVCPVAVKWVYENKPT